MKINNWCMCQVTLICLMLICQINGNRQTKNRPQLLAGADLISLLILLKIIFEQFL